MGIQKIEREESMTAIERRSLSLQCDIILRRAERSDLAKLEWFGMYTHFRRVFYKAYEEQIAGRRIMLVADLNNFPIGQIFIQLENLDDPLAVYGKRGYFYSLRVMEMFQRRGIGTALLQEAEHILRERSYQSVSIAAAKENPQARKLYERMGFKVFMEDSGRWQYIDHEGRTRHVVEPCWVLEKFLRD